jgi:hypothetical protein
MRRDSAHGTLFVKGLTGFEHLIREVHQFPHGGANYHHCGLSERTQALPEGANERVRPSRRDGWPVQRLAPQGIADF